MIPKIIHYCWISGEENMPEDIQECISSWHKYLPDYEFINWNDSNFDWNVCEFTKYCRENNLYAFCSDYIRFWAIYNYGGIYLDSDVMVYKSFNELLSLPYIITKEVGFNKANFLECAIFGGRKGDSKFKDILDWYNNCSDKWTKRHFIVSPAIMTRIWKSKYSFNNLESISDEVKSESINILPVNKYFKNNSPEAFAEHLFKTSWDSSSKENCLDNDNVKIFICAHKPIDNYIPKINKYVILDVTGKVTNFYNDNFHEIIDISQDEFTRTHNICYSEGCALRWLWKHQNILPKYIGFAHYRRLFTDLVGNEKNIIKQVNLHNAIIKSPSNFTNSTHINNIEIANYHHNKEYMDVLIQCIKEVYPALYPYFEEFSNDQNFYACNCFVMKKENFIEMCEICFKILDKFDEKLNLKNNFDVKKSIMKIIHKHHIFGNIDWQSRLQGFLLEYLTDSYYRYKWGVNNCCQLSLGIPTPLAKEYEDHISNEFICKHPGIYNLFANPKDDFMFNITCKNACSYIKYITLLNNNYNLEEVKDYHWEFIKNGLAYVPENMKYIIEPPEGQISIFNPDSYKMIYIWRDPFERFVSTYNDKIKKNLWFAYSDIGLTKDMSFEEFLKFTEHNIRTYKGIIEEHIRPQIDYYTTKIDYIVPIDKLQKFLQENNISNDFTFINSFPHSIEEYEKYRSRVYYLYKNDLEILEKYKDKVYK